MLISTAAAAKLGGLDRALLQAGLPTKQTARSKCRELAFVHIPKTGGTTVEHAWGGLRANCSTGRSQDRRSVFDSMECSLLAELSPRLPRSFGCHASAHLPCRLTRLGHVTALGLRTLVGPRWDNASQLLSFAVVRNPFDWLVSIL